MFRIKSICRLFILLLITISCVGEQRPDIIKILFIGNSYTYYNSSPEMVKGMINESFPKIKVEVKLISQGGMTLKGHWEDGRALDEIKKGDWDYVVLQEQSKLGVGIIIDQDMYFGQTDHFFEYSRKFNSEIKKTKAKTVFFMTWSTKNKPNEQEILTYAYNCIAKELNAIVAPVGLVWNELRFKKDFDLYDPDGSHPSKIGSYVASATIYSTIMNENPKGLSGKYSGYRLSSFGKPTLEDVPLVDVESIHNELIQREVWNSVSKINEKYLEIDEPKPNYVIPSVLKNEEIDFSSVSGRWYGVSTYSDSYLGVILDLKRNNQVLKGSLIFVSPDKKHQVIVEHIEITKDILEIVIQDKSRNMNSKVRFSLKENILTGVSKSFGGNITNYEHWNFSKNSIQSGIDLESLLVLLESYSANIEKDNYVSAALNHYKKYSSLIGKNYIPDEGYLNGEGYVHFQNGNLNEALNVLELAVVLYPNSANVYDSYGEVLLVSGQKEKAIRIYRRGVEIAKENNDENLEYIERNLDKLLKNETLELSNIIPPPPPPTQ